MKAFVLIISVILISGCIHEDEFRKELFDVEKRLVDLEHDIKDKQSTDNKQYISSSSRVESMEEEFQKMKGEVERLRIGVQTGELPGQTDQEDSIAKKIEKTKEQIKTLEKERETLEKLEERISDLEKSQMEILSILENYENKGGQKRKALDSLAEVEKAFKRRNYLHIIEDLPPALKKDSKNNIDFLFYYSESLFKLGKLKEAAVSYNDLIKKDKKDKYGSKSYFRIGDCFRFLGDNKAALSYYKQLLEKYPTGPESERVRNLVKKMENS
ncbi:MAG: tetratricopeptide repeat protein [Deltaproteobacteria bacterium]|nr:tetratricopeptide repeat protein [Deltaproteobacteria bacterium]